MNLTNQPVIIKSAATHKCLLRQSQLNMYGIRSPHSQPKQQQQRVDQACKAVHGQPTATSNSVAQTGQSRFQEPSSHRPDVAVVLVHPQIPQNTGNIARSCAATNVALHLVQPLGFELDDKKLKRAGLDYWQHVCVQVHDSWEAFFEYVQQLPGQQRLIGYTVYGTSYYAGPEMTYHPGDKNWLLFGAETSGLPLQVHEDIVRSGGSLVKIPILDTYVRSLNQSVSVGVGLFEALRQLDAGKHDVQPRDDAASPAVKLLTPMQQQQQKLQKA